MQTSNKFKPCKKCNCRHCRRYSTYKQFMIRYGNRQFRQQGKQALRLSDIEDFSSRIVGIGYTD